MNKNKNLRKRYLSKDNRKFDTNKKIHPLFSRYVKSISQDHRFIDPYSRVAFSFKCIGYLDCLFDKYHGQARMTTEDYMYLKNRIKLMVRI